MTSPTMQARVEAFEDELLGWLAAARPGVPTFGLPDVKTVKSGLCISCGDPISTGWRCAECLAAVHHVLTEFSR